MSRRRALALFRRSSELMSDGIALRGFDEREATELRRLLVEEKRVHIERSTGIEVESAGPIHDALREVGIGDVRVLAIPVRGLEAERGVLWILEDDRAFDTARDPERAEIVAEHANLALGNCERYVRAKERAFIDDVTELYNARYLHEAMQREVQRATRYGSSLSVLFLDLDRFKQVNDRHGHLVGSRALHQLGRVLCDCVRQIDTLARYGGDEFTILLVDTGLETAIQVAERIRKTVEDHVFEAGRDGALRLTVSIGVAAYPLHGRTREALLDLSDKAMYRAKSIGRNRVCTATELES
jgi:diguanylate cyclase (GGDEF)-like protein